MMAYNNKLVVAIKSNGKILREHSDTIYIKYGSEYSILIKNLNTVRALVNIFIDGSSVIEDGLCLYGGQEIDLERWVNSNNLSTGNRFKFIERTTDIEKHRGIKLEDGLLRVEYQFEKPRPVNVYRGQFGSHGLIGPSGPTGIYGHSADFTIGQGDVYSINCTNLNLTASQDIGITVPGSKSNQAFISLPSFDLELEKYSIVLKLLGETNNKLVTETITTKTKIKCQTCGKLSKSDIKFCSRCGTSLVVY